MNGWHFDIYSALIGSIVTMALLGVVYAFRAQLASAWQGLSEAVDNALEQITAGVSGWYRQAVVKWAQEAHVLSGVTLLEQVFVMPYLIPPPPRIAPDSSESFAWEPLPLNLVLQSHPHLLLTGETGSGRTTLLAYLALVHAQKNPAPELELPAKRLPLYIHLGSQDWSLPQEPGPEEEAIKEEDEAGPAQTVEEKKKDELDDEAMLIQLAIRSIGASPTAAGALRKSLKRGEALILIDGWDELNPVDQEQATAWLTRLVEALPGSFWLVAVGRRGFAPLAQTGFVPLHLAQWEDKQIDAFLAQFSAALAAATEKKKKEKGTEEEEKPSLREISRALLYAADKEQPALDLALRAWLLLTTGQAPEGRQELYMQSLERMLERSEKEEEAWLSTALIFTLGKMALNLQQEGRGEMSKAEIQELLEVALPPLEERPARADARAWQALTDTGGPLLCRAPDRYAFAHLLFQASLVARQIAVQPTAAIIQHLDDPRWLPVVEFYAEQGEMKPLLQRWLSKPDDLWRSRLRTVGRWAALADKGASWRSGVMALLARAFLDPALPDEVRKLVGKSLAQTGDPGVPLFLRKTQQHPQPILRAAAVRALGHLWGLVDLSSLAAALADPEEPVQGAATAALGRVGTPAAIRWLTQALNEGGETLRVEAARGLAAAGDEGYEILREAAAAEDFLTRRAAAFGLGEINAEWARQMLTRMVREDDQWIVQSAASTVLGQIKASSPAPIPPPPDPSAMGWLIAWAAERGKGVGLGEAALAVLLEAMKEGEAPVRRAAVQALGMIGRMEHVVAVREMLDDPEADVVQAAMWALAEIGRRYDVVVR